MAEAAGTACESSSALAFLIGLDGDGPLSEALFTAREGDGTIEGFLWMGDFGNARAAEDTGSLCSDDIAGAELT